jgi:hypothetical protein
MLFKIIFTLITFCMFISIIYSQFSTIKLPVFNELNIIFTSNIPFGNLIRIRANSNYIVRLSDINTIDIWSAKD